MSDLRKYIEHRKQVDSEFKNGFDEGYEAFKIGMLLKQAREATGMTQTEVAKKLHTQGSVISRIENHAEHIRLSTLEKLAAALGRTLEVSKKNGQLAEDKCLLTHEKLAAVLEKNFEVSIR